MAWTSEDIEQLIDMWQRGKSGNQIAMALGGKHTCNAVIGKAWRMNLERRVRIADAEDGAEEDGMVEPSRETKKSPDGEQVADPAEEDIPTSEHRKPHRKESRGPAVRELTSSTTLKATSGRPDISSSTCRWPLDEPGRLGLHICGGTIQPGRQYCAKHLTAAYLAQKRA